MPAQAIEHELEEQVRKMTPVSAPPEQLGDVVELSRLLDGLTKAPSGECRLVGPSGEELTIPQSVFYVLERVAEVMARGDSITVVPVGKELTTQQAADILNVSRQYLVRLLGDDRIPYTKTGRHRRLRLGDVLAFKKNRDASRRAKLDKLSQMSQDFGGYDELE